MNATRPNNWPTRVQLESLMRAEGWKPWERCFAGDGRTAATTRPSLTVPGVSISVCAECARTYDALVALRGAA